MKTVQSETEIRNFFLSQSSGSVNVYNSDLGEYQVCDNYVHAIEFFNRRKSHNYDNSQHYNHITNMTSDDSSSNYSSPSYESNSSSDYSSSSDSSSSSSSFDGGSGGDSGGGGSDSSY